MKLFVVGRLAIVATCALMMSACGADEGSPNNNAAPFGEGAVVAEEEYVQAVLATASCVREELPEAEVMTTKLPTGYYQLEIEDTDGFEKADSAYGQCSSRFLEPVEAAYVPDPLLYPSPEEHFIDEMRECLISVGQDPPELDDVATAIQASAGTPCEVRRSSEG